MKMEINPRVISELAREVEITDPIEWGNLAVSEESAYNMMALSVMEMVQKLERDDDDQKTQVILMASLTKLLVENFVLNLRLQSND